MIFRFSLEKFKLTNISLNYFNYLILLTMRNLGINPATGGQRVGTAGILLSFSPQVQYLKGPNKTPVRYVTCRATNPQGEVKVYNAIMYEKNFQKGGFKLGDSLALTIEINQNYPNPLFVLSHLHAGERATNQEWLAALSVEPTPTAADVAGVTAGNIREMQPEGQDA
jgi:hypothetical protein